MNIDIVEVLQELGFEIVHNNDRVVSAVIVNDSPHCFRLFIDTKYKRIDLKIIYEVMERDLLFSQSFSDSQNIKALIIGNWTFERFSRYVSM
jgi:hypothetical protein